MDRSQIEFCLFQALLALLGPAFRSRGSGGKSNGLAVSNPEDETELIEMHQDSDAMELERASPPPVERGCLQERDQNHQCTR